MNQALTPQQQKIFAAWCALAMEHMPYMAATLYTHHPVATTNTWAAAVDNHGRIYLNFDTITRLGPRFGAQALLHECSHVLAGHFAIASTLPGAAGTDAWLRAADCAINDDLIESGCDLIAQEGIAPATYQLPNWKTPQWYWTKLRDEEQQQQTQQPGSPDAGPGSNGDSGAPGSQGDVSGAPTQCTPGKAMRGKSHCCGTGSGGPAMPGELAEDNDLDGTAPSVSDADLEHARESTAQAIINHQKTIGNVPAHMVVEAQVILAVAPIPWQSLITGIFNNYVQRWRSGGAHPNWSKRSRRHSNTTILRSDGTRARVFIPATRKPVATAAVVVDLSGSMQPKDVGTALAHIASISKKLGIRGRDLKVLMVDTKVGAVVDYTGPQNLTHALVGGGGTDMSEGIRHIWAMRKTERPAVCVVLTDGFTDWPQTSGPVPVIAGIINTGAVAEKTAQNVPSWIHTVVIDTDLSH